MSGRILIVDDDVGFGRALERMLRQAGHDVLRAETAKEARTVFAQSRPDVVVLDYQLPDADGLALLDELRRSDAGPVFLVATAYPDLDTAVDAMRRGAFDYVAKEADTRECILRVERGAEVAALRRRVAEAEALGSSGDERSMLGTSPAMVRLRERVEALRGADDTTVLITGETGTGKGVLARLLHLRSGRAYEPFVAVDCTTIAPTLAESELFGHEKGAFSGAGQTKLGRVEVAGTGTLFLDEIGDLPLPMQAKLLRLLEEKEFTRVGGNRPRALKARVIAATNRHLAQAVAEGWFRADLRYRLEVFLLEVPPLRERDDDVVLLAAHFAAERARALGRPPPRLAPAVIEKLRRYPFPGNVRELRNMVEQAVLLMQGPELQVSDFPVLDRATVAPLGPGGRPSWQDGSSRFRHPTAHMDPGSREGAPTLPRSALSQSALSQPALARPALPHRALPHPEGSRGRSFSADGHTVSDGEWHLRDAPTREAPVVDAYAPAKSPSIGTIRRRFQGEEKQRVIQALEETGGNVSAAARLLQLSRYQVLRRMEKYGLR